MSEHSIPAPATRIPETRRRGRVAPGLATVLLIILAVYASREAPLPSTTPVVAGETENAVAKVSAFLKTLDETQRSKALLPYDSPKKSSWSNLPVTMVPRNGVRLGELDKQQREAAFAAIASVLSKEGYQKVIDIMEADDRLIKGGENKMKFGTENFYLAIFGKPSATEPWMLQFGGHHLGINVTVVGKQSVLTPTHTGTQPASFMRKGKTVRPLGPENDLAFKLINMLDEKQKKQAIIAAKPRNLALGPGQDNKSITAEGIKGAALNDMQRETLLQLIGAWVHILPRDDAARRLGEIKSKLDETHFAWYGPTTDGSAVYYRIQGPAVVIEYAPQGSPDHIHTVIRNPGNDYAGELTRP